MTYDTIVIGGGPAGSAASTVLAQKGRRVVLLEREKFPRYHIGESLIPYTYFTLQRIGMIEKMKASHFPKKYSVQFVGRNGRLSAPFYFYQQLEHEASCTWQVLRSEFDQMLLDNAREKGVEVREETNVRETIVEDGVVKGVRAVTKSGETIELRAPMTIDASGRDALTVSRSRWKKRDPQLDKIAVWTYYKGAKRDPGIDEGATTVAYLPDKGWFWYIPLPDDVISVGIVAEKEYLHRESRDPQTIFHAEVEQNLWIRQHLASGQQFGPYRTTGEYSYRSTHCASDGLVLAGDAFAFLDPVFSSGVFLALRSGEMAADAVDAALTAGDVSASRFDAYGRDLCAGIENMRKLVYVFYDNEFSFRTFLNKHPDMKGDMTDCLMGHLSRDFDPMFSAVSKFANVPTPLDHGQTDGWSGYRSMSQLAKLQALFKEILGRNSFYTTKLNAAGIDAPPASLEEFFRRTPFTLKTELSADQTAHPPYGTNLTYPIERYTRFGQTSATTGRPMRWLDTPESWAWMVQVWRRVFECSGVHEGDRVFFTFSFGPFLGFWLAFEAAIQMGCLVIPGGGMRSVARIEMLLENDVTVLCCTPTYAIRLAEIAAEEGIDLRRSKVRILLVAGEPGGSIPATRALLERLWPGARVADHHGMTEIGAVSYECPKRPRVLHVVDAEYISEVVDPATGERLERGSRGELVLTNLGRVGSPLIRYRTGDIVQTTAGRCECGSDELALEGGILARADDMVVVRGVNVYPAAIEEAIRSCDGIAEYRVEIGVMRGMAEMTVEIEPAAGHADPASVIHHVETALNRTFGMRVPVKMVPNGHLPRFEMKAKRWTRAASAETV